VSAQGEKKLRELQSKKHNGNGGKKNKGNPE
jgi:hypothetical protein